jgi:hypothetical protein
MISANFLLYTSVLLVSISISSVIVNFLFPEFKVRISAFNTNGKTGKFALSFIIIASLIGLALYFIFVFGEKKPKVDEKTVQLMLKKSEENENLKKLLQEQNKTQEITKVIQSYLDADHSRNINRIDSFYTFPLEKFYTMANVSKEKANERTEFYWRHHSDSELILTKENFEIRFQGKDSIQVSIKLSENKKQIIFSNIKLNQDHKI